MKRVLKLIYDPMQGVSFNDCNAEKMAHTILDYATRDPKVGENNTVRSVYPIANEIVILAVRVLYRENKKYSDALDLHLYLCLDSGEEVKVGRINTDGRYADFLSQYDHIINPYSALLMRAL